MSYVMQVDRIDSEERGVTQNEWLQSKHTYSFGNYYNLKRLNFGTLSVFNDDIVEPGKGFKAHRHDNMEIITIVLDGALEHRDSSGHHGILKVGDVQRMTAGTGIEHSENNASLDTKAHFLQIWIYPQERDLEPGYELKTFTDETFKNTLFPIISNIHSETALFIHQDATFYMGHFDANQTIQHRPSSKKYGDYLFVIEGEVQLGDSRFKAGDSAQITQTDQIEMQAKTASKILLIEVSVNTL
ncbi:MAG: putative quercetin 2,3-dioxygenase [Chlamydiae bacterium]|nr:putative quercetin 2,3-dioxygenase [Chlamydiota bacterium]